jgi:membrane protease YdiL (CAAX protease family)
VWLLGLIWSVWHYPFSIYSTLVSVQADVPPAAVGITIVSALAGQTMSLIAMTYLYTWMYNHTESVFLAILFHALSNLMPLVFVTGMGMTVNLLLALTPWLVVFVLERIIGKDRFPGPPVGVS